MASQSVILHNLQKTNQHLQYELRKLNKKVNDAVYTKDTEPTTIKKDYQEFDNLSLLNKRIELYENEFQRLNSRVQKLSDSAYESFLIQKIQNKEKRLIQLETSIRNRAFINKRKGDKLLITAEETGEEIQPTVAKFHKNINIYTLKVKSLEFKLEKLKQSQEESSKKLTEFSEKHSQLLKEKLSPPTNTVQLDLQNRYNSLKKELDYTDKKYEVALKRLQNSVMSLEKDLKTKSSEYHSLSSSFQLKEENILELKAKEEQIKLLKHIKFRSKHSIRFMSEPLPRLPRNSESPRFHHTSFLK